MSVDQSTPLLRDWDLLQEQVIPQLLDVERRSRQPRLWAVGSVADAVAVTAAYRHAGGRGDGLTAFASQTHVDTNAATFSLSELRVLPPGSRQDSFRRAAAEGWVAEDALAEQVRLSAPTKPVDLVTLRTSGSGTDGAALDRLREGGLLLVVEPDGSLARADALRPLGRSGRLFTKRTSAQPDRSGAIDEDHAETLALHQARSDLVVSHSRLARSLARRFSHHGETKEDLEQVALLALVKAARRFDPQRGISFSTFATASVLGEIKRHFRDKTWMMRVPRSVQEVYLAVKDARDALTQELSASPTIAQIAGRLGVSEEAVLEAIEAGDNYWLDSLDVGVFEGDAGRDVPVNDGGFDLTLERSRLTTLMPRLAPRERLILKHIYYDGWTQKQVADEIGVSQMQVSRLLSGTLEKLRHWAED